MQVTRLAESDAVLARTHYPDGTECSLSRMLRSAEATFAEPSGPSALLPKCWDAERGDGGTVHCPTVGVSSCAEAEGQPASQPGADGPGDVRDSSAGAVAVPNVGIERADEQSEAADPLEAAASADASHRNPDSGRAAVQRALDLRKESNRESGLSDHGASVECAAAATSACPLGGMRTGREVDATVFPWHKPEQAASLLRSVLQEWGCAFES